MNKHGLSSQPCESTFRQFRSLSTVYWTKFNLTLLEIFHAVGRIELQNDIRYFKIPDVNFARTNFNMPAVAGDLPSNEEIFGIMKASKLEAIRDASNFGMQTPPDGALECKLTPRVPNTKTLSDESMFQSDQLCADIEQLQLQETPESAPNTLRTINSDLNLRDYTDRNVVLSDSSPYTEVKDKSGNAKVVRKSSIVWLLTTSKSNLSSDRLRRV